MSAHNSSRQRAARAAALPRVAQAPVALVVDDEPLVRHFFSTVLRREGWDVLEAPDAVAAMALARRGLPDLLVTDYEMPATTGLTLARSLRELNAELPILMVSGHPEVADQIGSLHGHAAFAPKPLGAAELVTSVGALIH